MSELWLPSSVEFTDEEVEERRKAKDFFEQLALKIRDAYREDPTLTINDLLERLGEDVGYDHIVFVLNEFKIVDGEPQYAGQGLGGGWIEESERIKLITGFDAPIPEHEDIGNRWPDGSLREEVFDPENNVHRAEFNLPPLEQPADQQ